MRCIESPPLLCGCFKTLIGCMGQDTHASDGTLKPQMHHIMCILLSTAETIFAAKARIIVQLPPHCKWGDVTYKESPPPLHGHFKILIGCMGQTTHATSGTLKPQMMHHTIMCRPLLTLEPYFSARASMVQLFLHDKCGDVTYEELHGHFKTLIGCMG